jgi:hypothetical protein
MRWRGPVGCGQGELIMDPASFFQLQHAAARSRTIGLLLLGWLVLASAIAAAGLLRRLPPPALPVILFGLTAVVLAAGWSVAGLRAWLATVDERWLLGLHLTRFVGAYFLYLYGQGQLPYAFAVPGGLGDIAVAVLAAALLVWGPPRDARRRLAYVAWNVLGLVDILFVVATAGRLTVVDPASMGALLRLPLSLLATFLVPLIIASHVVLGVRLARGGAGPRPGW